MVDDSATSRRILVEMLDGAGMAVTAADSVAAALAALVAAEARRAPFSIVLSSTRHVGTLRCAWTSSAAPSRPGMPPSAFRVAHSLKGALGALGARDALALATLLDDMGRNGDISAAPEALNRLELEIHQLAALLAGFVTPAGQV